MDPLTQLIQDGNWQDYAARRLPQYQKERQEAALLLRMTLFLWGLMLFLTRISHPALLWGMTALPIGYYWLFVHAQVLYYTGVLRDPDYREPDWSVRLYGGKILRYQPKAVLLRPVCAPSGDDLLRPAAPGPAPDAHLLYPSQNPETEGETHAL